MSNIINQHINDNSEIDITSSKSNYSENDTDSDYSKNDDSTDSEYSDNSDSTEIEFEDIYVISIDDKPYFYELSLSDAENKVLNVSKKINKKINENELYDSYVCHKKDDELTIVNQLDFIFFTKSYVLHTLKIHRLTKN